MRRLALALLVFAPALIAEVKLPNVFSAHGVLQREMPIHVWGWSAPAEKVTIVFHGQTAMATADTYGRWETSLKPEEAGGPYTLTVTGSATAQPIIREDILVGDVWVASGQSNMEMPLKGFNVKTPIKDSDKEIAAANHPRMRLLLQTRRTSTVAMDDTDDTWTTCTPDTAKNFSAVAYFFGREISEKEHVPVGLIDTTWGGTPAHSWISSNGLADMQSVTEDYGKVAADQSRGTVIRRLWAQQDAADKAAGRTPAVHPALPDEHGGSWVPSTLYNAMISPFVPYGIKGVIWYQGEADTTPLRAAAYYRLFSGLIQDWRAQWSLGDFPFLFVQISSYKANDGWPRTRDAQRRTLQLVNTGMAVTLDVGNVENVHPADKQTVGTRLAANALGGVYGRKVETSSPLFKAADREAGTLRVWFTHGEGLTSKGQPLGGFEVAGEDHKFVAADAHLEKVGKEDTVIVSAATVPDPKYVRYDWSDVVSTYLYNSAGYPASTFTSEYSEY